uniref:hypothetical protein n=1 Tax=Flavobacterium sp. TaxID=239 RepID=UPI00404954EA
MNTSNKKEKNLAKPGKPMSQEAFLGLIKEAENGEFYTDQEFQQRFETWRLNRKNQ